MLSIEELGKLQATFARSQELPGRCPESRHGPLEPLEHSFLVSRVQLEYTPDQRDFVRYGHVRLPS